MKNPQPQPNKAFLTTDVLRSILNDDAIKGKKSKSDICRLSYAP